MEFDKRTIIAFALIGLILVFINTGLYQRILHGDRPPVPADSLRVAGQESGARDTLSSGAPWQAPDTSLAQGQPEKKRAEIVPEELQNAREISVETPLYRGVFSTLGGGIKSWQFKSYADEKGGPVVLVEGGKDNLTVVLPTAEDSLDTGLLNFSTEASDMMLGDGDEKELIFERQLAGGAVLRKAYRFHGKDYRIHLTVTLENFKEVVEGYDYSLVWRSPLHSTEKSLKEDMSYSGAYSAANEDAFDVGSKEFMTRDDEGTVTWTAVRTKYFTVAIIPRSNPGSGVKFAGRSTLQPGTKDTRLEKYQLDLKMPLYGSERVEHTFDVYLGPLDYDIMKRYGVGLESIMNLGWKIIQPFSIVVLWSLRAVHKFVPNYGIVIIVFSLLVKVILHPLTKKSTQSMKQMQALQPKMTELREKHGKDPQKLNQEMMLLYKEYGVNPLGGCLPMVLQMPLLYALFIVFRSTIEFRHAYFFGWINDLSAPDTIFHLPFSLPLYGDSVNVLPIFMGATMLIQQAMTVTDPKQKMMVYLMPVILTLAFNSFPSGLNLYYACFNLFSIIQQKYLTSVKPLDLESAKVELAKKRKRSGSFAQLRKGGLSAALSRKRFMKR